MVYNYRTSFIRQILGSDAKVSSSRDGKAVQVTNEIADDISLKMTFRPSKSTGNAVDVRFNNEKNIEHFGDNLSW